MNRRTRPGQRAGRRNHPRVLVAGLGAAALIAAGAGFAYASVSGPPSSPAGGCLGLPACPGSHISPQKAAKFRRLEEAMAAARQHPAVKPAAYHVPAQQPAAARVSGVVDAHQSPFPSTEFTVSNSWQGPVAGRWIVAFAGTWAGLSDSSHTGTVALFDEPVNPNSAPYFNLIGVYHAPKGDLGLTVVSYRGGVLTLKTTTGAAVRFDVASHSFS